MANTPITIETFAKADELMQICRSAVRKALAKNRRLGIANVYFFDGERYFELPNGDFIRKPRESISEEDRG